MDRNFDPLSMMIGTSVRIERHTFGIKVISSGRNKNKFDATKMFDKSHKFLENNES